MAGKKGANTDMSIIGQKFNRLTVESFAFTRNNRAFFNCRCECGEIRPVGGTYVKNGRTKACLKCGNEGNRRFFPEGQTFGHMKVLRRCSTPDGRSNDSGGSWYECECDACGDDCQICVDGKCFTTTRRLQNGDSNSCGCLMYDHSDTRNHDPQTTNLIRVFDHYPDTDLSLEEFAAFISQNCDYCGAAPSNRFNEFWGAKTRSAEEIAGFDIVYNGLDRVNSNGDHGRDNIVPCCFPCQVGKFDMTVDEFKAEVTLLYHSFATQPERILPSFEEMAVRVVMPTFESDRVIVDAEPKPILGITFGKLTVVESNDGLHRCECSCDDRTIVMATTDELITGQVRSCMCGGTVPTDRRVKNLTGAQFRHLTVIGWDIGRKASNGSMIWQCYCHPCGAIKSIAGPYLIRGQAKSCGCQEHNLDHVRMYDPYMANVIEAFKDYRDGNLTLEQFTVLVSQDCFYCGKAPSNTCNQQKRRKTWSEAEKARYTFTYSGLDCIDPTKPHNLDNVVPCCGTHNIMKWVQQIDAFRAWIVRVYHFFVLGEGKATLAA